MIIYLVQHGEALSEEINPERPLSEQGKKDIRNLGKFLKNLSVNARLIYHSPKKRAIETAELMNEELGGGLRLVEETSLSPEEKPEGIIKSINRLKEDLIIVGHLPNLGAFSRRLLKGLEDRCIFNFKPGSLLILENVEGKWRVMAFIPTDFFRVQI